MLTTKGTYLKSIHQENTDKDKKNKKIAGDPEFNHDKASVQVS